MSSEIRIPKQKRAIEKREKIITKGFELICEKGCHNVSIKDIAKYANISIGVVYAYFENTNDIFIEGVKNYSSNIMFPIINILKENKIDANNLIEKINIILNIITNLYIKDHKITKKSYEELLTMSRLDSDIKDSNIAITNINEKFHIIIGLIENYCHEVVYHKHENLDYDIMKEELITIIVNILNKKQVKI